MSVSGSCLCGAFRYSVDGSFGDVRYCHCSQCRRKSGTAFTANARIDTTQWSLEGPSELVTEFEQQPGLYNAFCARCGSPLYARSDFDPEGVRVRLGGFEGELDALEIAFVTSYNRLARDYCDPYRRRLTAVSILARSDVNSFEDGAVGQQTLSVEFEVSGTCIGCNDNAGNNITFTFLGKQSI